MQDENTTQSAATDGSPDEATTELNLGSNPAAQPSPATDSSATDVPLPDPTNGDGATSTEPADNTAPSDTPATGAAVPSGQSDELESIKSSALQELLPMVNELDQEPEEKYRTLMMLIQSSDNQSLIKDAFDAAHGIEDKKAKAEALLNIINEINYFTGKGAEKSED